MKRVIKTFFLCLAIVAASCKSSVPEAPEMPEEIPAKPDIAAELETVMKRHNAVGLAVAVVDGGKIIYEKTLGYKDLEGKAAWKSDDILRIASISKSFTATSIMQLVEQGKLDLDADVSGILGFNVRNPKYPDIPITVRMLLSHVSSLSDSNGYFSMDNLNSRAWNSYEPGTRYQYCNLGYNTLGAIVEKVSGERFDMYVQNHILKPLGVYAGYNVHDLDPGKFVQIYRYNSAEGYYEKSEAYPSIEKELEDYTLGYSTPLFSPTGGLKISVGGLAKVMMMHMNQGTADGVKILDRESCRLMQSEITPTNYEGERYGMALLRTSDFLKGHRLVGHDGIALGAHTAMFWDLSGRYGFVVMTNGCSGKTDKVFTNILCESAECLYRNLIEE